MDTYRMDKQDFREDRWDALEAEGEARFPFPPHGRIPNFAGAREAAQRLTTLEWWEAAETVKCNPDAPQRPVRSRALAAGKTVVMAAPRLRGDRPFIRIDPEAVDDPDDASTIGGAHEHGQAIGLESLPTIDGIVVGSVVVDTDGNRIGKGEGYSDLEFAILLETGAIDHDVTVATTVHDLQVTDETLPTDDHDVPVDHIATPTTIINALDRSPRPTGIDWDTLSSDRVEELPILTALSRHK